MRFVDEFKKFIVRVGEEYKKFIMRGNAVDLAVGIVIGAAFTGIVDSLVKDMFMPIIGLITGGFNVSRQTITYKDAHIGWGNLLQQIINFVIIGFCLFLVVKAMNRLLKREEAKPTLEPTPTEKLLTEIRDLLARGELPVPVPPVDKLHVG